jgi:hypothetical protein
VKVLIDIPDSVGPDLDRLRALVGDTNMRMRILEDDGTLRSDSAPEKIVKHFNISVDERQRLRVYGVVVDENRDEIGMYAVIVAEADDERRAMGMLR